MSRHTSSVSSRLLDLLCVVVLGLLLAFLAGAIARAMPAAALGQEGAHPGQPGIHPVHAAGTNAADCANPTRPDAPAVAGGAPTVGGLPASMTLPGCAADTSGTPAAAAAR